MKEVEELVLRRHKREGPQENMDEMKSEGSQVTQGKGGSEGHVLSDWQNA